MEHNIYDLVIRHGRLVTAHQTMDADLGIREGKIAAIDAGLRGREEIDAQGLLVLPGGVDPHVHLEMPVGETRSSDDWFSGTRAAAFGGTTTVIDFVEPQPGESLESALEARRGLAQGKAVIDFGLHMTIPRAESLWLREIPLLCGQGCTSFKTYTTYEGFKLADAALLKVFEAVSAAGGTVLVHAENDAIIRSLRQRFRAEGKTAPRYHALSRPPIAEGEAIQRSLALAEVSGARVYIVHVSTALGVDAVRAAKRRGVQVVAETCPQYLLLTDQELDRPGFGGAKFVCSPPLRSADDNRALWQGLAAGDLGTVGTDHCPFFYEGQKELGRDTYEKIPGGLPGIELRLALLYTYGVCRGILSLNRWVELCCTHPAQVFGLYPQKGSLEVGADADLTIFDPDRKESIVHAGLHEQVDYTPYEGFELQGAVVGTISHGRVIVKDGKFLGKAGAGQYLQRQPYSPSMEQA